MCWKEASEELAMRSFLSLAVGCPSFGLAYPALGSPAAPEKCVFGLEAKPLIHSFTCFSFQGTALFLDVLIV